MLKKTIHDKKSKILLLPEILALNKQLSTIKKERHKTKLEARRNKLVLKLMLRLLISIFTIAGTLFSLNLFTKNNTIKATQEQNTQIENSMNQKKPLPSPFQVKLGILNELTVRKGANYINQNKPVYDKTILSNLFKKYNLPNNLQNVLKNKIDYAQLGKSKNLLIIFGEGHDCPYILKNNWEDLLLLKKSLNFVLAPEGLLVTRENKLERTLYNLIFADQPTEGLDIDQKYNILRKWDPTLSLRGLGLLEERTLFAVDKRENGEDIYSRSVEMLENALSLLETDNVVFACGYAHGCHIAHLAQTMDVSVLIISPDVNFNLSETGISTEFNGIKYQSTLTINDLHKLDFIISIFKEGNEVPIFVINRGTEGLEKIKQIQNKEEKEFLKKLYLMHLSAIQLSYEKAFKINQENLEAKLGKYLDSPDKFIATSQALKYLDDINSQVFNDRILPNETAQFHSLNLLDLKKRYFFSLINDFLKKQYNYQTITSADFYNKYFAKNSSYNCHKALWLATAREVFYGYGNYGSILEVPAYHQAIQVFFSGFKKRSFLAKDIYNLFEDWH